MTRFAILDADNVVAGIAIAKSALEPFWIELPAGSPVAQGWTYNNGVFTAPVVVPDPPKVNKLIHPAALFARMTQPEEVNLLLALWINPNDTVANRRTSAALQVRKAAILVQPHVKLTAPKIVNFFNDLELNGVLAAGRATAILSAPITDDEVDNL